MTTHFIRFLQNDHGTAAAEYAVVMTVFAISLIGVFQLFLGTSGSQLTGTQSQLQTTAMVLPSPKPGT